MPEPSVTTDKLKNATPILNISALATASGIPKTTLFTLLQRNGDLTKFPDKHRRITEALEQHGIVLL